MTFARCPEQAQVAVLGRQVFSGSNEAHGTMMVVWGGGGVEGWGVEKWGGVGQPLSCLLAFPTVLWAPTSTPTSLCDWLSWPPGDGFLHHTSTKLRSLFSKAYLKV